MACERSSGQRTGNGELYQSIHGMDHMSAKLYRLCYVLLTALWISTRSRKYTEAGLIDYPRWSKCMGFEYAPL